MENLERIDLEYSINTIPKILFYRLSNPSGLEEWFANKVTLEDGIYTFIWDRSEQQAKLIEKKSDNYIRFKWLDSEEGTYFEFSIHKQELTGDVALQIIDFAEQDEKESIIEMWNEQVEGLKHTLGV
ncbi:MAG: START-like domain-containing protein [Bacteroidales bacterium]|nr:START-like domain-containing protein [Bacteroidales bacterium]